MRRKALNGRWYNICALKGGLTAKRFPIDLLTKRGTKVFARAYGSPL